MKKIINTITVRLFGSIPFKDIYEHPKQEIEWRGFIRMEVEKLNEDERRFKLYTNKK